MTTLIQAVTRAREEGLIARSGSVHVSQLQRQFLAPGAPGSLRALVAAMTDRSAIRRPYAVILCRFKGDTPHPDEKRWKTFFDDAFRRGTGSIVEYWRDISLGKIDVSGSHVFDWTEVDMARADAGFPPTRRGDLTDAAIRAVQAQGKDPLTGYHNQISIYMYRETAAGKPIDGSTDGNTNRTNLTAPFDRQVTAHEMGHSLGMDHDADVTGDTNYHDPCCLMSQQGSFVLQPWGVAFGPAICLPHLLLQGWMYTRRVLFDNGAWSSQAGGIALRLAPNSQPWSPAQLGASLTNPELNPEWAYLLEVVAATDWNRGVTGLPCLMIRRTSSATDLPGKTTAMYLGRVPIHQSGATAVFYEASGNTTFSVAQVDARGPVVSVRAEKGRHG